jgi:hypothetical protein
LKYYGYAQAHNSSRVEGSTIGVGIIGDCDIKISHFNFQLLEALYEAFCNISLDRKKFKAVNFKDDSIRVFNAFAKKYSTESFQFSEAKSGVGGSVDYIVVKSFSDLDLLTNTNGLGSRVYFSVDAKHVERYYNLYSDGARFFSIEGGKMIDVVKVRKEKRDAEIRKQKEQDDAAAKKAKEQQGQAFNPQKKALPLIDSVEYEELRRTLKSKLNEIANFKKYLALSVCFGFVLLGVCLYLMITAPEEKKGATQSPNQGGDVTAPKTDIVADSVKKELDYLSKLALAPDKIEFLTPWFRSIYELSIESEKISKSDTTKLDNLKTLRKEYDRVKTKFEANSKQVLDCLEIKIDTKAILKKYK